MAYFDQAFGGGGGAGVGGGGMTLQSLLASLKQGGGMAGGPQLPQVGKAATDATPVGFPSAVQPPQANPTAQLELLQKLLAGNGGGGGLASLFGGLGGIGGGGGGSPWNYGGGPGLGSAGFGGTGGY